MDEFLKPGLRRYLVVVPRPPPQATLCLCGGGRFARGISYSGARCARILSARSPPRGRGGVARKKKKKSLKASGRHPLEASGRPLEDFALLEFGA